MKLFFQALTSGRRNQLKKLKIAFFSHCASEEIVAISELKKKPLQ